MYGKCDKCREVSEIYYELQQVFATPLTYKLCRNCGKKLEAIINE